LIFTPNLNGEKNTEWFFGSNLQCCLHATVLLAITLPKWCPAVALSRQDGHHSAVPLLLKAALIQVSDGSLVPIYNAACMPLFYWLLNIRWN
jgi:hypothetical protein